MSREQTLREVEKIANGEHGNEKDRVLLRYVRELENDIRFDCEHEYSTRDNPDGGFAAEVDAAWQRAEKP